MYKMYDSQWDEESEDENSSLNSAFWSDGEGEEEKVEQYNQEDTEPNRTTEHAQEEPPVVEPPVEESPKETEQEERRGERAKRGEKERFDDEEGYSTRAGSPALSLVTSGYGTYRPDSSAKDDPEGEDYRDDCTIAEFDRESQGLSEMRDGDEDDQSLANCDGDGKEDTTDLQSCEDAGLRTKLEDSQSLSNMAYCDDHPPVELESKDRTDVNYCEDDYALAQTENDKAALDGIYPEDSSLTECKDDERPTREGYSKEDGKEEKGAEDEQEREDLESLASNEDMKLIDSKSTKTYKEWEDNRRHKRGAVSGLEERLGSMSTHQESELESEDAGSLSDRSESDRLSSAFKAYIRGMARSRSESDVRPRPKSFIRPVMDHPHTKNLKKTDPVAKYFQYKQDWEMFKAPGEKDRKALHWEIREQLTYKPQPPKPQRVFVPNTYVVPTEKKRSALRWEIRHDLANGLLPPTNYRL
ncbi:DNA ligase 1 isoform X1 [Coregonus clupeaformis]|uniref:DNA ligase 1 isoform X1 n=1 Tax=Coregonus clupeaformis TaxID=59861 RepID=UPI001E1C5114|nr:DNA ligase 1 isoform X1 [Coregonus clupeaformis]